MKRIILDHLERWYWAWLLYGIAYLIIGALFLHDGKLVQELTIFFLFWAGVYQLNYDLQQRHLAALVTLPVTSAQIGRAWWLVSVGLPALLLAATSGVGLYGRDYFQHTPFPTGLFVENSVINTCYLAVFFFVLIALPNRRPHGAKEYFEAIGLGGLALCFMTETLRFQKAKADSPEMIIFFLTGTLFTIGGWFSAGQLVIRRKSFGPLQPHTHKKELTRSTSKKFGGIPFFIATRIFQTALITFVVDAFLGAVVLANEGRPFNFNSDFIFLVNANIGCLCFLVVLQGMPFLKQLRLLRTLPISATRLAVLSVALPLLLCLTASIWPTAIAIPTEGITKGLEIPATFAACGAFLTLCIPIAIVLDFNQLAMFAVYFSMTFGMAMFEFWLMPKTPLPLGLAAAGLLILLSFFFTKKCLENSDNAYRIWPNPAGAGWK